MVLYIAYLNSIIEFLNVCLTNDIDMRQLLKK